MSFVWLAAWLIKRRPKVQMFSKWNDWGIALAVCGIIDLTSGMGRSTGAAWKRSRAAKRAHVSENETTPSPVPATVA